jgi:hypothetical protein
MSNENESVSFNLLLNSILQTHKNKREQQVDEITGVQFVDFSEEELTRLVQVLWNDRYTNSRDEFKNSVSEAIANRVKKIET